VTSLAAPLAGHGVRLEPLAEAHRDGLRAAIADAPVWEILLVTGQGPHFDPMFTEMLESGASGKRVPFAVVSADTVVGITTFYNVVPPHKRLDIGFTIYSPAVWGTHVNPACKLLLLGRAFDEWGANRVGFEVDSLNQRSQAAVTKLGANRDGVLRSHAITHTGRIRDTVIFSIIPADWPAVRDRLLARLAGRTGPD
jgi:RimJ/RimL family protein N-acetyltransferase